MFLSQLFSRFRSQKMSKTNVGNNDGIGTEKLIIGGTSPKLKQSRVGNPKPQRSKRIYKSDRAGLKLPVAKIHKVLKRQKLAPRIGIAAAVYMAAVLEYIVGEMLELAGQAAVYNNKIRISYRHLILAIRYDKELNILNKSLAEGDAGVGSKYQRNKQTSLKIRD